MSRYNCSLSGECETDSEGEYQDYETCRRECRGAEAKEILRLIYDYSPEESTHLGPSDRVHLIKQFTGVTVLGKDSRKIVKALAERDPIQLGSFPVLWDYIKRKYGVMTLRSALVKAQTLESVRKWSEITLRKQGTAPYHHEFTRLVREALESQNIPVLRYLTTQDSDKVENIFTHSPLIQNYPLIEPVFNGSRVRPSAVKLGFINGALEHWSPEQLTALLPEQITALLPELRRYRRYLQRYYPGFRYPPLVETWLEQEGILD